LQVNFRSNKQVVTMKMSIQSVPYTYTEPAVSNKSFQTFNAIYTAYSTFKNFVSAYKIYLWLSYGPHNNQRIFL
jgi:hypothetical protein